MEVFIKFEEEVAKQQRMKAKYAEERAKTPSAQLQRSPKPDIGTAAQSFRDTLISASNLGPNQDKMVEWKGCEADAYM
jgi:hypothetical protein